MKIQAYGEVGMRNSKHWERKSVLKAAATACLYGNNHGSKQGSGATTLQLEGELGKQKEEKEVDVYNCYLECVYFSTKSEGADNVEVKYIKGTATT